MLRKRKNTRQQYKETNDEENDDGERKFNLMEQVKSERFEQLRETHLLELNGHELNLKLIQRNGFDKPILVEKQDGLDLLVPSKSFIVRDVRNYVGHQRIIDVMDVKTQKNIEMSMKDWCKYYESKHRDKLLNVISLEFSHTKLDDLVEAPLIVRLLDWVDLVWPKFLKQSQVESTNSITSMKYPKVQKYCLMSVKGSYTDFHIDFGGTSVWYHILRGKKIFWMVPPTELNLQIFEEWTLSGMQQDVFFGDTVEECFRVELTAGNTFFIPSGWIHAVYTLEDSLVFGGNFLHSFGMENQLKVSKIEDATKVPHKFRYPFYTEILWYVVQHYVYCLTDKDHLHRHELEAMAAKEKELAEAALLEKNNNKIDNIEIEDETTESEHDDSDNNNSINNNNKKKTKKQTTSTSKTRKRSKASPTKKGPSNKKKKKPPTPPSSEDDDNDDDDDETDIDSSNEDLYGDKPNKPATNTCRMTKNSLLRLQYEVEENQEKEQLQTSPNKSTTSSGSGKSPTKKKITNTSLSSTESPTKSIASSSSPITSAQKKQQQIASTTINLAEIMLSQNESKLNGWSSGGGASQAIWSNPSSESKEPLKIHITKYEVNGLKILVKHLSKLSGAKKNLPNLIRNSRALLDDCRKLIAEHENDDPELAITGKPITPELLRKPKTTDMNELIGQFFKPSADTTGNDELADNNNSNSNNINNNGKHAMISSASKSKFESGLSSHKCKSYLNSSEHSTTNSKNEEDKTSINNSNSCSHDNALGSSSSSSSSLKSSPHKETKCLSPNKKFSSTATSSTSVNSNSSPPPKPKSPPTRPLSNNQYTSKTTKKFGVNLDLPGSFKDLIAATSSAKEAFNVKGSDVTSTLFGTTTTTKDLASPKSASSQMKQSSKNSGSKPATDSLKSPLDIITSTSLMTPSSSSASNSTGAGTGNTNHNKEALPSPNFSVNNEPAKSTGQVQKRFINPQTIRAQQPNKEKLIYASAPYVSPVNMSDSRSQNQPYPWQTPTQHQPHPQHHHNPLQHTPNPPHQISNQNHLSAQQHQPSTYSATAQKQHSSHSNNLNQSSTSDSSFSGDARQTNNQSHHHHHHHHPHAQLDLIPLSKNQSKDREKIKSLSLHKNKIDDNNQLGGGETNKLASLSSLNKPLPTNQQAKYSVPTINNNPASTKPTTSSTTSTPVTGVAGNKVTDNDDADQKTKKPNKPRGPPKKSKEARQAIEQEIGTQTSVPEFNPVSVIKIEKTPTQMQASGSSMNLSSTSKPEQALQSSTPQSSNLDKPKNKRPKKAKESSSTTSSLPQQVQQHQPQQHLIHTLMPNLQQHQLRPTQSVICGIVRPPTTSAGGTIITQAGVAPRMGQQQYMITRPLLFNTMPTFSTAQFQQMSRAQMPLFTAPMGSQFGLPLQQGARIVWATQPRGIQPNPRAPLIATTPTSTATMTTSVSSQTQTTTHPTMTTAPMCNPAAAVKALAASATSQTPKTAHQQDNNALLSLATTALSTAPMTSAPTLSHLSNRVSAPQAIMMSSAANQPALFTAANGQQYLRHPFLQRMPMTQFVTQPTTSRPTTGQLVYARLPNQGQPRYLITQPGFMQPRFATGPPIVTSQPGSTLAYATFKNPATDSSKAIKTKKVKTS